MAAGPGPSQVCGARVVGADRVVSPRGWLLPWRTLEEDVLLYVRRGSGELTLAESTYPVRRDHLYLLRRGVPHLLRADARRAIEYWAIQFVLLDAHGDPLNASDLGIPDVVPTKGRHALERLFVECVHQALHCPGGRLALLAALFGLLDDLTDGVECAAAPPGASGDGARSRHSAQVMAAVALMMEHVTGDISLEELAAHAEMSPSHFAKVFKRVMGSTPHAYYTGLKMERAKQQIAAGRGTLTQIAQELGFASLHHFSRTFKRYEGELPSRYAQRVRSK